jgi:hypothetical protein
MMPTPTKMRVLGAMLFHHLHRSQSLVAHIQRPTYCQTAISVDVEEGRDVNGGAEIVERHLHPQSTCQDIHINDTCMPPSI